MRIFPSPLLSGYTNIIPPTRKTKRGVSMSKNGNKIAVVGCASRIGCAAMTVAAAAILTASTLRAEPFEQTSPEALITALQGVYGSHPGLRKNHAKGMCATGSFVGLSEQRPIHARRSSRARPSPSLHASHSLAATLFRPAPTRRRFGLPAARSSRPARTFTGATPQEGAECKNIDYDPLVMSDRIAPTDDPVPLFRSPSYAGPSLENEHRN